MITEVTARDNVPRLEDTAIYTGRNGAPTSSVDSTTSKVRVGRLLRKN
jgi:hypothetical protein